MRTVARNGGQGTKAGMYRHSSASGLSSQYSSRSVCCTGKTDVTNPQQFGFCKSTALQPPCATLECRNALRVPLLSAEMQLISAKKQAWVCLWSCFLISLVLMVEGEGRIECIDGSLSARKGGSWLVPTFFCKGSHVKNLQASSYPLKIVLVLPV